MPVLQACLVLPDSLVILVSIVSDEPKVTPSRRATACDKYQGVSFRWNRFLVWVLMMIIVASGLLNTIMVLQFCYHYNSFFARERHKTIKHVLCPAHYPSGGLQMRTRHVNMVVLTLGKTKRSILFFLLCCGWDNFCCHVWKYVYSKRLFSWSLSVSRRWKKEQFASVFPFPVPISTPTPDKKA